jgi:co-chaperonin GroES (HSP10)
MSPKDALAQGAKSATFYPAQRPKVTDKRPDYSEAAEKKKAAAALEEREKQLKQRAERIRAEGVRALEIGAELRPIGDRVICWRIPEAESMIVEADIAARLPLECVVVSISDRPSDSYAEAALRSLTGGDHVTILSQSGTDLVIDGISLVAIHVHDIIVRHA